MTTQTREAPRYIPITGLQEASDDSEITCTIEGVEYKLTFADAIEALVLFQRLRAQDLAANGGARTQEQVDAMTQEERAALEANSVGLQHVAALTDNEIGLMILRVGFVAALANQYGQILSAEARVRGVHVIPERVIRQIKFRDAMRQGPAAMIALLAEEEDEFEVAEVIESVIEG